MTWLRRLWVRVRHGAWLRAYEQEERRQEAARENLG